jgi:murein DD-endopeptidase MepM/ murein hydrolase activator NlpD
MRRAVLAALMLSAGCFVFGQTQTAERYQKVARQFVDAFNKADYEGIEALFGSHMRSAFPLEKAKPFFLQTSSFYGKIVELDTPRLSPPNRALFLAHCEQGNLDIDLSLEDNDKLASLALRPPAKPITLAKRNESKLSLPFSGRWRVLNGGDTRDLNAHHDVANQQFAFDFVGVDDEGNTFKGLGKENEDYYGFGREVLSPGEGVVVDVIEGVRDNKPGSLNPYSALGNTVFIQHRDNEISVLAHLKLGSTRVKVRDKVKMGQVIGRCGNSGNSSGPHLHYHLEDTAIIQNAVGIKCYFTKYVREKDGKTDHLTNNSPIQGEIIYSE